MGLACAMRAQESRLLVANGATRHYSLSADGDDDDDDDVDEDDVYIMADDPRGQAERGHGRVQVEPYIVKKDTVMRNSITAEARLEATLRYYLASGRIISAIKKVLIHINGDDLPINKRDYMKLIEMCFKCASFSFIGKAFYQHEGLPMASPQSAVAACLFMETLEQKEYIKIIPNNSNWYRYVDDCILVFPKHTSIINILSQLNQNHPRIRLTVEHEVNGSLPFLDTVVIRENSTVKFKVYRKPARKDDYIQYFSAYDHNQKTKTGVVMGFFL
ncbi:uncharacterized protein LOC143018776 [Oratosquilla oratoria]|uniref:uncharacterized protein LOC143018776 n=1 Tax=Oratosquilla oratoria TaxID=337810 RepID=UPI003F761313